MGTALEFPANLFQAIGKHRDPHLKSYPAASCWSNMPNSGPTQWWVLHRTQPQNCVSSPKKNHGSQGCFCGTMHHSGSWAAQAARWRAMVSLRGQAQLEATETQTVPWGDVSLFCLIVKQYPAEHPSHLPLETSVNVPQKTWVSKKISDVNKTVKFTKS